MMSHRDNPERQSDQGCYRQCSSLVRIMRNCTVQKNPDAVIQALLTSYSVAISTGFLLYLIRMKLIMRGLPGVQKPPGNSCNCQAANSP